MSWPVEGMTRRLPPWPARPKAHTGARRERPAADRCLSGNGLLTAVVLGRLAGATATRLAM